MKKTELAAVLSRESRRRLPAVTSAPETTGETTPVPVSASARKVRMVVDLVSAEYRDFRTWRDREAERLGWSRVTAQDVMRDLVRLLSDEQLQREVIDQLRQQRR